MSDKKVGIILSIREKSVRLPGKVLMQISGQSVTELLIDRIKTVKNADHIIIGTSDDPRDSVFSSIAETKQTDIFFGARDDKLLRYLQICNYFDLYAAVIVDGDDILCFPEIMEENISLLKSGQYDVIFWKNLPLGAASSGLSKLALEKVISLKAENDTEVWGGYFRDSSLFNILLKVSPDPLYNHPEIRMTMDYEEDFLFLKEIFGYFIKSKLFTSNELMKLLVEIKPQLNNMTVDAQKRYEENIKKAKPVKFKQK